MFILNLHFNWEFLFNTIFFSFFSNRSYTSLMKSENMKTNEVRTVLLLNAEIKGLLLYCLLYNNNNNNICSPQWSLPRWILSMCLFAGWLRFWWLHVRVNWLSVTGRNMRTFSMSKREEWICWGLFFPCSFFKDTHEGRHTSLIE